MRWLQLLALVTLCATVTYAQNNPLLGILNQLGGSGAKGKGKVGAKGKGCGAKGKAPCPTPAPETEYDILKRTIDSMGRQLMLQQLFVEERIRGDGDSGLKQMRNTQSGSKSYFSPSIAAESLFGMHDHPEKKSVVGLDDFVAVINGVEFKTSHNDYAVRMPSRTTKDLHAVEDIPLPDVPFRVMNKNTTQEQITEMKEWFKAWKNQVPQGERAWKKFFKPVLCYLEGAWTRIDPETIEEFDELLEEQYMSKFTSYSGRDAGGDTHPYRPVKIMNIIDRTPIFGQWNYRTACHPIKADIHPDFFRPIDDLATRVVNDADYKSYGDSPAARFQLNIRPSANWPQERFYKENLLDEIFKEIPGKDNYQGKLTDDAFGLPVHGLAPMSPAINSAYYHRAFRVEKRDAMGTQVRHRGYADASLYMAQTSQPDVLGMNVRDCKKVRVKDFLGRMRRVEQCTDYSQKWSYAIPLEIIFLTPLSKWNPYNLKYQGDATTPMGRTASEGRTGGFSKDTAYNGTNSDLYFLTPSEFYNSDDGNAAPSDRNVGVLDSDGLVRSLAASGIRTTFTVPDVGTFRTRFPIMPLHHEGNAASKELDALKDIVMENGRYMDLMRDAKTLTPEEKKIRARIERQKKRQEEIRKAKEALKEELEKELAKHIGNELENAIIGEETGM
ncbi:unnamed protein product [Owenia fusiformis]|uniref:Uncharacterized protein n=1 Tax=Owenia fusiformis TaxID=6347 RepID=A0A8J1UUZ7_OWEFU|nr:unnamed protein product [Owenia fusiformis]